MEAPVTVDLSRKKEVGVKSNELTSELERFLIIKTNLNCSKCRLKQDRFRANFKSLSFFYESDERSLNLRIAMTIKFVWYKMSPTVEH